jgi:hypothetical protein
MTQEELAQQSAECPWRQLPFCQKDGVVAPKKRALVLALTCVAMVSIADTLAGFSLLDRRWPSGEIVMEVQIGSASGLIDGSPGWDDCAITGLTQWNQNLGGTGVRFTPVLGSTRTPAEADDVNSVFFSGDIFGTPFGAQTLAVTQTLVFVIDGVDRTSESDVIYNNAQGFNCYRGAARLGPTPESSDTWDLQRIALHEFGHVLGLDHPDQASPPQMVDAIMNTFIDDTDTLRLDDIQGVATLYGFPGTSGCVPPGGQIQSFFSCRDSASRDSLLREGVHQSNVDTEGAATWFPQWLRYVVSGCSETEATTRVMLELDGLGVQPVCREVAPGTATS